MGVYVNHIINSVSHWAYSREERRGEVQTHNIMQTHKTAMEIKNGVS